MKQFQNPSQIVIFRLLQQAPKSPIDMWNSIKSNGQARLIKVDDSIFDSQIFKSDNYLPQTANYKPKYQELIKSHSQGYLNHTDIYGASHTDHEWATKISEGADYALMFFELNKLRAIQKFLNNSSTFTNNNPAANITAKNESYDYSYLSQFGVLNEGPKWQWFKAGTTNVLATVGSAGILNWYHGDQNGAGVQVGSVSDNSSTAEIAKNRQKTNKVSSIHREIQNYIQAITTAVKNCIESIVGKSASEELLGMERLISEANTMCQKYLDSFFKNKNELLKDAFTAKLSKENANLLNLRTSFDKLTDLLLSNDWQSNPTKATINNNPDLSKIHAILDQIKGKNIKYESSFNKSASYDEGSGEAASVNISPSEDSRLSIPQTNMENCYNNIRQLVQDKINTSLKTPKEEWKIVVDASTYMHKEAENVDKEIKNRINQVCNVTDDNKKADYGSFGGKLRSRMPYKADGLRTLWGQKYITMMKLLDNRIERDIINGAPLQYLENTLKITFPAVVSIMLTYRYIYEQIEQATSKVQLTDIKGLNSNLDDINTIQTNSINATWNNLSNLVDYISGFNNGNNSNANNNKYIDNLWFEIFAIYGKLLVPYEAPIPNSSNGATQTQYYYPRDQVTYFNNFITLSPSQKIEEIFENILYDELFYDEVSKKLDKAAISIIKDLKNNDAITNPINVYDLSQNPLNYNLQLVAIYQLLKQAADKVESFVNPNKNKETVWNTTLYSLRTNNALQNAIQSNALNSAKEYSYEYTNNKLFEAEDEQQSTEHTNNVDAEVTQSVQNLTTKTSEPSSQNGGEPNAETVKSEVVGGVSVSPSKENTTEAASTKEKTTTTEEVDEKAAESRLKTTIKNLQESYKIDKNPIVGVNLIIALMQNQKDPSQYSNAINALTVDAMGGEANYDENLAKQELQAFIAKITKKGESKSQTKPTENTTTAAPQQQQSNESVVYFYKNNKILMND